jgi:Asp-tRNA(Asn)/Glu-tRNA(Gln) amidotransferase A subunit family amidase
MTDLPFDDIAKLSKDLRHRTISPLEITAALLARIDTSEYPCGGGRLAANSSSP